jgi:hypothetical protein
MVLGRRAAVAAPGSGVLGQVAFTYVMAGMSREIDAPKKWRAASEFAVRPLEFAFGERWEPA